MIGEIARREIVTRARSKAYKISTAVIAALTVLFVLGVVLFPDSADDTIEIDIGVAPDAAVDVAALRAALESIVPGDVESSVIELDADDVDGSVSHGDVDVALRDGSVLVWNDEPDPFAESVVVEALTSVAIDSRAAELGVSPDDLSTLLTPIDVRIEQLDPPSDSETARAVVATIGIFLMFFAIQSYGSQIAMVVVEEKANRIVEILLSLVRPNALLVGKIVGVGVLAAVQLVIPLIGIGAALALSDFTDVPLSAYASLPLLFVVFVLGFTMYGALFALVGSLVSRQEDAQQAILPIFLPIFVGYALAFQAVASPESTLAQIVSVVPFTAPFALPVTVAQGASSPWTIALALALLVVTTVLLLRLAARVYEFTLLRSGSRIPLRDALRLARRSN